MAQNAKKMAKNQIYKSVQDFIQILRLFNDFKTAELSVTEISNGLRLETSKVSRMLAMLEEENVFERSRNTGKYRLAILFFELGLTFAFHFPLRKIMRPHLEEIAKEKKHAVSWNLLKNDKLITIDRIDNNNIDTIAHRFDTITHRIGLDIPIHSTSAGKILLAYQPEDEQERILKSTKLTKFSQTTIIDPELIKKELKLTSQRGYATDLGETFQGVNCISTPIRGSDGEVIASLNLMARESNIAAEEFIKGAEGYLKEKALFISRQLGFLYAAP